jgi:hypothetical protein
MKHNSAFLAEDRRLWGGMTAAMWISFVPQSDFNGIPQLDDGTGTERDKPPCLYRVHDFLTSRRHYDGLALEAGKLVTE